MLIALNPSTVDEVSDDPTIRRCSACAMAWGYGALCMTNLFAYRATKPDDMKRAADPVGPDNDLHLRQLARDAAVVVAVWGVEGAYQAREQAVIALIPGLHNLRLTKAGHPAHPLYLPGDLTPMKCSE